MNIKFDRETDIVYLRFSDSEITESNEDKQGMVIDYDKTGNIAGIEVLDSSTKMEKLGSLVFEVD